MSADRLPIRKLIHMAKQVWNPGAMLAPLPPALVTCGQGEDINVLTIGWTGILCTKPPKTYISVRPERHSHHLLEQYGQFTINLPTTSMVRKVDLCGVRSGKDVNKFELCGLTPEPGTAVSCPSLAECPISIECRITGKQPLGSHDMFLADIVAVTVDERYVDKQGKLHIEKCDLLAYAHGTYFTLGDPIGTFGFSVRKKPLKQPHRKPKPKKEHK